MKSVVTIGGGTGHSQVLKALAGIPDVRITGICPSTDSGGSTGVLREMYGGNGYIGDVTKCAVALCPNEVLAAALSYRYEEGPLRGHSVKNLLFHALEQVSGTKRALETLWDVCQLGEHRIVPATEQKAELCVSLGMGNVISGETYIDTIADNPLWDPQMHSISDVYLNPQVPASSSALDAIKEAEYIFISPGDLYSSIIPVLLPIGMKEAIAASAATVVIIVNIMTKKGETDNYTTSDFVERIEHRIGRTAQYIVYNNAPIPEEALARYSMERKVERQTTKDLADTRFISAPLAAVSQSGHIYSDPVALRQVIADIMVLGGPAPTV